MQAFLWRMALVGITLTTLIGSIILVVVEPSAGSVLGVIGSLGSLLGTFVTTGLDITQTKRLQPLATPPVYPRPTAISGSNSSISWLAVIQTATIGSIITGFIGLLPELHWSIALICFCLQYITYGLLGAAYVWFARHNLGKGSGVRGGAAFVGSALAAIFPGIVTVVAENISSFVFGSSVEGTAADTIGGAIIAFCFLLFVSPLFAGITGLIVASIWRDS